MIGSSRQVSAQNGCIFFTEASINLADDPLLFKWVPGDYEADLCSQTPLPASQMHPKRAENADGKNTHGLETVYGAS